MKNVFKENTTAKNEFYDKLKKYAKNGKIPLTHATPAKNIESIKTHGLRVRENDDQISWGGDPGVYFLLGHIDPSDEWADHWGATPPEKTYLIYVNWPIGRIRELEADPIVAKEWHNDWGDPDDQTMMNKISSDDKEFPEKVLSYSLDKHDDVPIPLVIRHNVPINMISGIELVTYNS